MNDVGAMHPKCLIMAYHFMNCHISMQFSTNKPLKEVVRYRVSCYQTAEPYWLCLTLPVDHYNTELQSLHIVLNYPIN